MKRDGISWFVSICLAIFGLSGCGVQPVLIVVAPSPQAPTPATGAVSGVGPAVDCPVPSVRPAKTLFFEDFERGADRWVTTREPTSSFLTPGGPVVLSRDPQGAACTTQYQRETIPWGSGRVFSRDPLPVAPGGSYCLSAWVRTTPRSAACIGVVGSGAAWRPVVSQVDWLVCRAGYQGRRGGGLSVGVVDDARWHRYDVPFTAAVDQTHVLVMSEIWMEAEQGVADFDDIRLVEGGCPP